MAKTIVPRKARKTKGTGGSVDHPPKGLTLADVRITRRVLNKELTRISGPDLAQLLEAMKPENGRPWLEPGVIWDELVCLAELLHVLSEADHHGDREMPLEKSLYWIGERLKRLGHCVMALEQSGNSAPNWYAVEVKK